MTYTTTYTDYHAKYHTIFCSYSQVLKSLFFPKSTGIYSRAGGNTSIIQIGQESHLHPTLFPLGESCMFPYIFLDSVIQASE